MKKGGNERKEEEEKGKGTIVKGKIAESAGSKGDQFSVLLGGLKILGKNASDGGDQARLLSDKLSVVLWLQVGGQSVAGVFLSFFLSFWSILSRQRVPMASRAFWRV